MTDDLPGWRRVVELGPEQRREAQARSAAARAAVRRFHQPGNEFGRGWDAALCAVYELVGDVRGLRVLLCGLLGARGRNGSESDGAGSRRPG